MIFGESDLRNPLWSILSVFLYFLGLQQKGQLVELAARQGQNNHKELWKELKFPCCFFFGEIFPQVLKGSQEKKGMLQHWSFIQADVDMSFPSTRNPWIKKSRSCKRYLISPASNMASLSSSAKFQGVCRYIWMSCVLFFEVFECPTFHIPWCGCAEAAAEVFFKRMTNAMPNYGAISQQGETGNRKQNQWDGDTWRIIAELVSGYCNGW